MRRAACIVLLALNTTAARLAPTTWGSRMKRTAAPISLTLEHTIGVRAERPSLESMNCCIHTSMRCSIVGSPRCTTKSPSLNILHPYGRGRELRPSRLPIAPELRQARKTNFKSYETSASARLALSCRLSLVQMRRLPCLQALSAVFGQHQPWRLFFQEDVLLHFRHWRFEAPLFY